MDPAVDSGIFDSACQLRHIYTVFMEYLEIQTSHILILNQPHLLLLSHNSRWWRGSSTTQKESRGYASSTILLRAMEWQDKLLCVRFQKVGINTKQTHILKSNRNFYAIPDRNTTVPSLCNCITTRLPMS